MYMSVADPLFTEICKNYHMFRSWAMGAYSAPLPTKKKTFCEQSGYAEYEIVC